MPRTRWLWIALLPALSIGCDARRDGPGPSSVPARGAAGAPLETVRPASGGELVKLPAGTFTMGDPTRPDAPPHTVSVGAFLIDRTPVTQALYQRLMGVNPSKRKGPELPVERTQWTDAARFCNRCSELDGLTPCYDTTTWTCRFDADGYRLPTEAEWEYACRAGSSGAFAHGDDPAELTRYAWFKPHSGGATHPVGTKASNRFGLFDMNGNVWQWCNDFYSDTYDTDYRKSDPRGPTQGKLRVLRGGAWDCPAERCRAGFRWKEFPVYSDACFGADSYGFRRVRSIGKPAPAHAHAPVVASAPVPTPAPTPRPADEPAPTTASTPAAAPSGTIDPARLKGTIAFVSDRGGALKIWKMRANGRDPAQLTRGAEPDADPRFSPDGSTILYTTLRGGFPEVWSMKADGSSPAPVTKGAQASWSPDGKSIVFIRDDQAHVRSLANGQERRLSPEGWERCGVPAWAPDGRRIALASRHTGQIGIFLIDPDGRAPAPLESAEPCCTPHWSRDGASILCQTVQGHIQQVSLDGRDPEQQTFGADVQHDARYSPDGSLIVFCRAPTPEGPWQICVKALDGDDTDVVTLTTEGSNLLPDWHANEP